MIHQPEALLNKVVRFVEDVVVDQKNNIKINKGVEGFVTADLDDVPAINLHEFVEGIDYGWVTFKDMSWLRDKLEIVEE